MKKKFQTNDLKKARMIFEEKCNFYQGHVESTKLRIGNDLVGKAKHLTDDEHTHFSPPSEMCTFQGWLVEKCHACSSRIKHLLSLSSYKDSKHV